MNFIWQVQYEIEPSLEKSESVDGINFEVVNGKTIVTQQHITCNYDDIINTVCNDYMNMLRNYILRRMLYQKTYQPIIVKITTPPILLNREELKNKGAKLTRKVMASLEMRWSILDVNDSLAESENFWNSGFTGKSNGLDIELLRIASWIEKSEAEHDHIQQFILTWVAFNSLYGLYSKEVSNNNFYAEIHQFTETVSNLLKISDANEIFKIHETNINYLSNKNFQLRNGTNCSYDLGLELKNKKTRNHLSIITRTLECIYCIRNQCFHNGPQATDLPHFIKEARDVLLSIVAICARNFVVIK